MSKISVYLGTFDREGQMQKYYIFLNLEPAACPAQANTTVLQLPIIETRAEGLLGLARANGQIASLECSRSGLLLSKIFVQTPSGKLKKLYQTPAEVKLQSMICGQKWTVCKK
jgi:hypothetical protein